MLTLRIMVRPMKYAAFGVPFILPIELYGISLRDALDSWRQVDVVSDKECLTGGGFQANGNKIRGCVGGSLHSPRQTGEVNVKADLRVCHLCDLSIELSGGAGATTKATSAGRTD